MKVKEIMTQAAVSCVPETNVGSAVELMWNRNVGMLPVVDRDGKLVGVVTDRDICIALGTRNRLPGDLTVGEIAIAKPFTCRPNDDIHEALDTMASAQVRRLPVVSDQGMPLGILSMDDILIHTDSGKHLGVPELSAPEVIRSLKRVYGLKFPVMQKKVAAG